MNHSGQFLLRILLVLVILFGRHSYAKTWLPHKSDDTITIHLKFIEGLPIGYLSVNGSGPLPFLIDSAAPQTLLSARSAAELSLKTFTSGQRTVSGSGGVRVENNLWAKDVSIVVGHQRVIRGTVPVSDLSGIQGRLHLPVAGILGFDVLRAHAVLLDYRRSKLQIFPKPLRNVENLVPLSSKACGSVPLVELPFTLDTASKTTPNIFLLDTGSNGSVILTNTYLQKTLPLAEQTLHTVQLVGLTGSFQALDGLAARIRVGSTLSDLHDVSVALTSTGTMAQEDYIGSIGSKLIRSHKLYIDCPEDGIYLAQ